MPNVPFGPNREYYILPLSETPLPRERVVPESAAETPSVIPFDPQNAVSGTTDDVSRAVQPYILADAGIGVVSPYVNDSGIDLNTLSLADIGGGGDGEIFLAELDDTEPADDTGRFPPVITMRPDPSGPDDPAA